MPAQLHTLRSIVLIASFLGLVLVSVFLCRSNLTDIQQTSVSIYQDRLVPTAIIVDLTSAVYRKRLLLEDYALDSSRKAHAPGLKWQIDQANRRIDSLLTAFSQTKLTTSEATGLQLFQRRLAVYNESETELLDTPLSVQAAVNGTSLVRQFSPLIEELNGLAALQVQVGEDLLAESRQKTNFILVLTACQIGLVLLIGLLVFQRRG